MTLEGILKERILFMREFYKKEFGKVVLSSLFVSIIMVTSIDWKFRAKETYSLIGVINGEFMSYMAAILLVELFILNLRYFSMLKERREGELLYTIPIKRSDLFLKQWKANMITLIISWMIPFISIAAFGSLSKIQVGNLILSFLSYIVVSAAIISCLLWLETKLQTQVAVGASFIGFWIIFPLFLRSLSTALIVCMGNLRLGFYPWLKNIICTFLYSKQYTNLCLIKMTKNQTEISHFLWLDQGYYQIFFVGMLLLVAMIAFFMVNARKNFDTFPYVKDLKKNQHRIRGVLIFMSVYSFITTIVISQLEAFAGYIMDSDIAGTFLSEYSRYMDDRNITSNYGSFFLILILSIAITAVIAVILKKREMIAMKNKKKRVLIREEEEK